MIHPRRITLITSAMLGVIALTSCDKATDVLSKVKDIAGIKASADIDQVTEKEGKKVIESESRLVVVEYYMDT